MEVLALRGRLGLTTLRRVLAGTKMIEFFVAGKPVPQGSLKFIKGHAIHQNANNLATWRSDIASTGRKAGLVPTNRPVSILLLFNMPRPKTVKRQMPTVPPDLDKLIRAVLDGLTGVAYEDDSQVVRITAAKVYDRQMGVQIGITNL